ncbi:hypothetical protein [Carboxylicivirga sp. N1Y90]|uniref:hypothetical protein n=1 Tax=Carboxylicivirga fragile TaxID=3417571 RepID=UPI003D326456|nr:hypothetical protein [Marinilabiliaceae bacterium N1Y90]
MRKVFLTTIIIFAFGLYSNAQSNWELGGRFGDDFALDVTIPLSKVPRLHGALYFDDNISLGTYFNWTFALEETPIGLKFYPGVGPELYFSDGLDVAAAGDFGVEYSFDFPLTIGLDWRPNFMITDNMRFNSDNWGVIARFRFGEGVKFVKSN